MFRHILIVAILAVLGSAQVFADASSVLVFPFENQSGDRNLDWIGEGIAELIIERLTSEPGLYVMQREDRLTGFEKLGLPETATISRATAMKLGWIAGRTTSLPADSAAAAPTISAFTPELRILPPPAPRPKSKSAGSWKMSYRLPVPFRGSCLR